MAETSRTADTLYTTTSLTNDLKSSMRGIRRKAEYLLKLDTVEDRMEAIETVHTKP